MLKNKIQIHSLAHFKVYFIFVVLPGQYRHLQATTNVNILVLR